MLNLILNKIEKNGAVALNYNKLYNGTLTVFNDGGVFKTVIDGANLNKEIKKSIPDVNSLVDFLTERSEYLSMMDAEEESAEIIVSLI